jgi:hypothetical protein
MPESQVDAFVRATEIENFLPVRGVNPASFSFFHRDGVVSPLDAPALHQVFSLYFAEIFSVVYFHVHKSCIFADFLVYQRSNWMCQGANKAISETFISSSWGIE